MTDDWQIGYEFGVWSPCNPRDILRNGKVVGQLMPNNRYERLTLECRQLEAEWPHGYPVCFSENEEDQREMEDAVRRLLARDPHEAGDGAAEADAVIDRGGTPMTRITSIPRVRAIKWKPESNRLVDAIRKVNCMSSLERMGAFIAEWSVAFPGASTWRIGWPENDPLGQVGSSDDET